VLRDPVHGDVYLTHEEIAVLDTPEMQRLRGVKQLGTTYLVYPGAVHTRFEHSIGTLHLTQRIIDAINLNAELDPRGCLGVSEEEARLIRMAALVHDVTHIPFGHNVEDQTGLLARHDSPERYRRMLGGDSAAGKVLARLGMAEDVMQILLSEEGGSGSVPPYWTQILADTICSDLLDYLARDAYFTGLKLGVDDRLANYFKVDRASGNLFIDLAKRDLLREDILSEIVRMLEARYYFSERVYYHHAKVAAGALVARAVELALVSGAVSEDDLYDRTDASLLDLLEQRSERAGAEVGSRIRNLLDGFRRRRLPKRACVFPRYANDEAQEALVARFFARDRAEERANVEARIADVVRFATGKRVEIIVYCPAARMQLKEVQTHVRWPGEGGGLEPLSVFADRVPRLADLERGYRDLWKFYVFADTSDTAVLRKVQEAALAELEGASNVYRIEDPAG
jgi:HD superfamily phosphohydrolase